MAGSAGITHRQFSLTVDESHRRQIVCHRRQFLTSPPAILALWTGKNCRLSVRDQSLDQSLRNTPPCAKEGAPPLGKAMRAVIPAALALEVVTSKTAGTGR